MNLKELFIPKISLLSVILCILIASVVVANQVAPVLVIHGISDTCDYRMPESIAESLNTYATCYPIGGHEASLASWF